MTSVATRRRQPAGLVNRGRLAADLARAIDGEVRFDPGAQALCAHPPVKVIVISNGTLGLAADGPAIVECVTDEHGLPGSIANVVAR
jgi:hypothetical protein